jgi:hypothetical protein
MSTRNLTMVVDRQHARGEGKGLAIHPSAVQSFSYVNMYLHHDGYPEWQGVQIANWLLENNRCDGSAMAAKLVHDHFYDSCYLYPLQDEIDHQYTYIIWSGDRDKTMVSCWDNYKTECVFVATPKDIISTYSDYTSYTDFANGETRFDENKKSNKVNLSLEDLNHIINVLKTSIN